MPYKFLGATLIGLWGSLILSDVSSWHALERLNAGKLTFLAAMTCCGVASGVMLFVNHRHWRPLTAISSAAFIINQKFPFIIFGLFLREVASLSDFYSRVAIFAKHPKVTALIIYFDLLLPLMFSGYFIFSVWSEIKGRTGAKNAI